MTDQKITLTAADYSRLMPLASGQVRPEGVDLRLVLGRNGSWLDRAEMLRRALADPEVDGGEGSMGIHLRRIDQGDRSFVALPIFVLRNFTGRDLYVKQGSPLRSARDLRGKRVGMYSWTASGSIWYRHFLRHHGVPAEEIKWVIGEVDKGYAVRTEGVLPPYVRVASRSLSDMLLDDELDAIYSPPRPGRYHPKTGPIARLHPDPKPVEAHYFRETGVFPPQHLMLLRREVWEADKSLARRITDAFVACETAFRVGIRSFPYASPWLDSDLEAADALIGDDVYRHGLEENRKTMEAFVHEAFLLGLTSREVSVDDYFAEFISS